MKKAKLAWIITCLAAVIIVVVIMILPCHDNLSVRETKPELPEDQAILAKAGSELQSVQKGDVFMFLIEVLYDPALVSGIDTNNLDNNVNLSPFEIRDMTEKKFNVDSGAHVYQRMYEIQLISGEVEKYYEFPTIVVRYQLKDIEGFADTSTVAEPIYVAPRLPDYIIDYSSSGYDPSHGESSVSISAKLDKNTLQPIKGEIEVFDQNPLPWILWILGFLLLLPVAITIIMRVYPQFIGKSGQINNKETECILHQDYLNLKNNIEVGVKTEILFHQIDHILRLILAKREGFHWLEEPNFASLSSKIKPEFTEIFEKCQKAYGTEGAKYEDLKESIKQLEEVMKFYYAEEMESWKI